MDQTLKEGQRKREEEREREREKERESKRETHHHYCISRLKKKNIKDRMQEVAEEDQLCR
jgi:hypothetical protein